MRGMLGRWERCRPATFRRQPMNQDQDQIENSESPDTTNPRCEDCGRPLKFYENPLCTQCLADRDVARRNAHHEAWRRTFRRNRGRAYEARNRCARKHPEPNRNLHDEQTRLEDAIKTLFLEPMDFGGTTPRQTLEVLREEAPDLCQSFNDATILACCQRIHQVEVAEESKRFQERTP